MEDRLRKQIADLKVTMPSTLPIQYVGTDLADQIIPIVRADCQREMIEWLEKRRKHFQPSNWGIEYYISHEDLIGLKSGTFKAEGKKGE